MKKLVLTTVVIGFAAIAAQAQGTGDGGVTREAFRLYYEARHQASAQKGQAARAADVAARKAAKQIEKEQYRRAKEQKMKQKDDRHFSHRPATGAMSDYAVEGRLQEQASVSRKPVSVEPTSSARPKHKRHAKVGNWIAGLMGFSKWAGESDEDHLKRLEAMAYLNK